MEIKLVTGLLVWLAVGAVVAMVVCPMLKDDQGDAGESNAGEHPIGHGLHGAMGQSHR